jgi:hypothetical protein
MSRRRRPQTCHRIFRLVIVQTGDLAQALPGLHAVLPNHGRRVHQAEAKRVVELLDVHAFHVVRDHHVPGLDVSD